MHARAGLGNVYIQNDWSLSSLGSLPATLQYLGGTVTVTNTKVPQPEVDALKGKSGGAKAQSYAPSVVRTPAGGR